MSSMNSANKIQNIPLINDQISHENRCSGLIISCLQKARTSSENEQTLAARMLFELSMNEERYLISAYCRERVIKTLEYLLEYGSLKVKNLVLLALINFVRLKQEVSKSKISEDSESMELDDTVIMNEISDATVMHRHCNRALETLLSITTSSEHNHQEPNIELTQSTNQGQEKSLEDEEISTLRHNLSFRENKLGKKHKDTLKAKQNLLTLLANRGYLQETTVHLRELYNIHQEVYTSNSQRDGAESNESSVETSTRRQLRREDRLGNAGITSSIAGGGGGGGSESSDYILVTPAPSNSSSPEQTSVTLSYSNSQTQSVHSDPLEDRENLQITMQSLVRILVHNNELHEARDVANRLLALRRTIYNENDPVIQSSRLEVEEIEQAITALNRLVEPESSGGGAVSRIESEHREDNIEMILRNTLASFERHFGRDDPRTLDMIQRLALYLPQHGYFEETQRLFRSLIEGRRDVHGEISIESLRATLGFAEVLSYYQEPENSQVQYENALRISTELYGEDHYETNQIRAILNLLARNVSSAMSNVQQTVADLPTFALNKGGDYSFNRAIPLRYQALPNPAVGGGNGMGTDPNSRNSSSRENPNDPPRIYTRDTAPAGHPNPINNFAPSAPYQLSDVIFSSSRSNPRLPSPDLLSPSTIEEATIDDNTPKTTDKAAGVRFAANPIRSLYNQQSSRSMSSVEMDESTHQADIALVRSTSISWDLRTRSDSSSSFPQFIATPRMFNDRTNSQLLDLQPEKKGKKKRIAITQASTRDDIQPTLLSINTASQSTSSLNLTNPQEQQLASSSDVILPGDETPPIMTYNQLSNSSGFRLPKQVSDEIEVEFRFGLKRYVNVLPLHPKKILSVAIFTPSPLNDRFCDPQVITGSEDGIARVYNLFTKAFIGKLEVKNHQSKIIAITVYVPNCKQSDSLDVKSPLVITGYEDGTIAVWNLLQLKLLIFMRKVDSNKKKGDSDKKGQSIGENETFLTINHSHSAAVNALSTFFCHEAVLNCHQEHHPHPVEDPKPLSNLNQSSLQPVRSLTASPAPTPLTILISTSTDKTTMIWNLHTGEFLKKFSGNHTDVILSVAFYVPPPPDDSVGSKNQVPFESGQDDDSKPEGQKLLLERAIRKRHPIIITASWDKTAIYWNLHTGKKLKVLTGHTKGVTSLIVFNPKVNFGASKAHNPVVITTSIDQTAVLWDLESGEMIRKFIGHTQKVNGVVAVDGPSGSPPLVITCSDDKKTIIWDMLTGEIVRTMEVHTAEVKSLAVYVHADLDGILLTTVSEDCQAIIWNLIKRVRFRNYKTDAVTSVALLEQDKSVKVLISAIDSTVTIFDLFDVKKSETKLIGHTQRINMVAVYDPKNNKGIAKKNPIAVTTSSDGTAKVWDLSDGSEILTFKGHAKLVYAVAIYDPDQCYKAEDANRTVNKKWYDDELGEQYTNKIKDLSRPLVITGSLDNKALIWDIYTGEVFIELCGHSKMVRAIAVHYPQYQSTSFPLVVTGSYDCITIIWNLLSGEKLRTLEGVHNQSIFAVCTYEKPLNPSSAGAVSNISSFLSENSKMISDSLTTRNVQDDLQGDDPLVVTGSYDHTAGVWNLRTGALIVRLCGHQDSITCMALYTGAEVPLLLTGSIDKTVVVWNLQTGEILDRIVGHTDRLMSIAIYDGPVGPIRPLLITGSDDKKTIVWEDCLYPFQVMPSSDCVERAFAHDSEVGQWPMISDFAVKYGIGLFIENSDLFNYAVMSGRHDFLKQFKPMLSYVVRFIAGDGDKASFLHSAIEKNDLESVRIILDGWIENLNHDIKDVLTQRLFHAMYFFHTERDLINLSRKYPSEFKNFICAIKLIRSHHSVKDKEVEVYDIQDKFRNRITATSDPSSTKIWKGGVLEGMMSNNRIGTTTRIKMRNQRGKPVTSMLLPLKDVAQYKMLKVYERISRDLDDDVSIFNSDVGKYSFRYVWEKDLSKAHWKAFIRYFGFLLLFTFAMLLYSRKENLENHSLDVIIPGMTSTAPASFSWMVYGGKMLLSIAMITTGMIQQIDKLSFASLRKSFDRRSNFLLIAVVSIVTWYFWNSPAQDDIYLLTAAPAFIHQLCLLIFIAYYGYEEYMQMLDSAESETSSAKFSLELFQSHFMDFWNIADLSAIVTGSIGVGIRLYNIVQHQGDNSWSRCFLALAAVFLWFKLLYFFRPYEESGTLVSMILQIAKDVRFFFLVLLCLLIGFALGFWLLCNQEKGSNFGYIMYSFLNAFMNMLGQNIQEFKENETYVFSTALQILFLVIMMILLQNALVSLMGESFSKVRAKGQAQWRLEQAGIILEQWFLLSDEHDIIPSYLHVLQYTSDLEFSSEKDLKSLKAKIEDKLSLLQIQRDGKAKFGTASILQAANRKMIQSDLQYVSGVKSSGGGGEDGMLNGNHYESIIQMQNRLDNMETVIKIDLLGLSEQIESIQLKSKDVDGALQAKIDTLEAKIDQMLTFIVQSLPTKT